MAQCDARTSCSRKKRQDLPPKQQLIVTPNISGVQLDQINKGFDGDEVRKKRVIGVVDEEKFEILRFCAIGFCPRPYSMQELAKEFSAASLKGFTVLRVSGSLVCWDIMRKN
ncbi:hypothetical protein V6N13_116223 [Hibiscus sabdariffa]|uniref:Uncharacterized protein n=1 Tax=Hibiscus sabdariffa TaxID=183260 RepID=A0ABR2PBZ5_9ROSI